MADEPVMLCFGPHPVHRRMGEAIGAEFVQCRTGGLRDRIKGARSRRFGDRPVILEGGVPLLEGAITKLARRASCLIALGADATYHDVVDPLPFRDRKSRLAHRVALRFVDGTLAVSERIARLAKRLSGGPAHVAHPFVLEERFERLGEIDPDLGGSEVVCVGKYRPKNGQDRLLDALEHVDADVTVHFVGEDTDSLGDGDRAVGHGFVSEGDLIERFERAALMAFPASAGAFPVATLEGLRAGVPVVVTEAVGTAGVCRLVNGRLVVDGTAVSLAGAIDWYCALGIDRRKLLGSRARRLGSQFDEATGLETFETQYHRLLEEL